MALRTNLWKTCITGEMQCMKMIWEMGNCRPNNSVGMGRMEKERKHGLRTANNTDRDAFDTMTKLVTWHAYTSLVLLILVQYTISALFSKVCLGS